jgi:hypothetical protein
VWGRDGEGAVALSGVRRLSSAAEVRRVWIVGRTTGEARAQQEVNWSTVAILFINICHCSIEKISFFVSA